MKVVCETCGSSFPFNIAKNFTECPVCHASFDDPIHDTVEKIDLEHPDMYFYDIDDEDNNDDLRDVWCQCTSCRKVNTISYNKFDIITPEYLRLKKDLNLTCRGCGKPFTNIMVPKRPDGWRELNMWEKDYENIPKCPTCSSTKIRKISVTSKVASAAMWGIFSRKVYKQWHCDTCGSEW